MRFPGITTALSVSVLVVALGGCSAKPPQQTTVMLQAGDLSITAREVRIHTFQYSQYFAAQVEIAADSIIKLTDDPRLEMRALIWKTNAIPEMQAAVFNLDPFVGMIDASILTRLHYEYFYNGIGEDRFGEYQPIAQGAAARLLARIDSAAVELRKAGLNIDAEHRFIEDWIERYPLDNHLFAVRSTSDLLASLMAQDQLQGLSAIGGIANQIDDLTYLLKSYGEIMPRQARWEAQRLLLEYGGELALDSTLVSAREFMEDFPEFFGTELDTAFVRLHGESAALMAFVDRQRMAAMADVATLADDKLDDLLLGFSRIADEQRAALMAELDSVANKTADRLVDRLDKTVDYFMFKLGLLLLLAIFFAATALFIVALLLRKTRPAPPG